LAYSVHELFLTLQGEGHHAGRRAVFVRFSGCNLWSGREQDRASAICQFCDTEFVGTDGPGGGRFASADDLVAAIDRCWGDVDGPPFIVFTGGEPLLQLDRALIDAAHGAGMLVAVESNGSIAAPDGIDWLTISPKAGAPWEQKSGDELKLVWPQDLDPESFLAHSFGSWRLQPKDGGDYEANLKATIAYCLEHPPWQLCLQQHKICAMP